jgi:outer membrane biosynthesis protein TonB
MTKKKAQGLDKFITFVDTAKKNEGKLNAVFNKKPGDQTEDKPQTDVKEVNEVEVAGSTQEMAEKPVKKEKSVESPEPEQEDIKPPVKRMVSSPGKSKEKPQYTTIRVTKQNKKAIELLVMSEKFEGVTNDTDMLEYIINYFKERKAHKEILAPFANMLKG